MKTGNIEKERKERVLMVHNFYQIGGGEHTVFENETKLLRDHGHAVFEYIRKNDELKESKLKLLLSPFSTIWSFKTYREIKKIIREQNIDIVHCHNTFPLISPSVYYAARRCKVPVIQTIHNFRFLCPNGTFYCDGHICELCREKESFRDALKKKCYRSSTIQTLIVVAMLRVHRILGTYKKINYIFLTEFNREKFRGLIDINGSNVFVKPNFVNGDNKTSHKMENKTFVFAGRLEDNKGIKLLVDRWKILPDDYKLHIYGDGTLTNLVQEAADTQSNITYYGFRKSAEVFEDLKSAAGLVFPSMWQEGFPMIIAESMALGCPMLATNIGNHADIVRQSQGGVLYDPESDDDFREAVKRTVEENEILSKNAKLYFITSLSKEKNYSLCKNIYDDIVYNGGRYSKVIEKPVFVFAGRLDKAKGILILLKAWAHLPNDYELRIFGSGECEEQVKIAEKDCHNIHYLGFQSHERIMNELSKATAMVFPSCLYEGYPMTIAESFSVGCPVVSTNGGNQAALIEEAKAGRLFNTLEINSLVNAIETTAKYRKEYSKSAYEYYLSNLTPEKNYKRMKEIYDSVTQIKRQPKS